ncbi:putative transcriptional regulator [Polaromonas sp. CF318]|jgi:DNA-binding transcriptional ArsR family regulator|nr:putative transcriptional regulator [Polaromonas sp. CF318]
MKTSVSVRAYRSCFTNPLSMEELPDIAAVASLLSSPARASMVWALIDGSRRPAGELAACADVSAQAASRHLALMLEGGLLEVQSNGRAREYRIANSEVACMIESMAALAAELAADRSLLARLPRKNSVQFQQARTCYDHFAGRFGVDLLKGMLSAGWLECKDQESEFQLTATGAEGFTEFGLDLSHARMQCRVFARPCSDITESAPHLGGALAASFLDICVNRGLVLRSRHSRTVSITPAGWEAFRRAGLFPSL